MRRGRAGEKALGRRRGENLWTASKGKTRPPFSHGEKVARSAGCGDRTSGIERVSPCPRPSAVRRRKPALAVTKDFARARKGGKRAVAGEIDPGLEIDAHGAREWPTPFGRLIERRGVLGLEAV